MHHAVVVEAHLDLAGHPLAVFLHVDVRHALDAGDALHGAVKDLVVAVLHELHVAAHAGADHDVGEVALEFALVHLEVGVELGALSVGQNADLGKLAAEDAVREGVHLHVRGHAELELVEGGLGHHQLDDHAGVEGNVDEFLSLDGRLADGEGARPPAAPGDLHGARVEDHAVRGGVDLRLGDLELEFGEAVRGAVALARALHDFGFDLPDDRLVLPLRAGEGARGPAHVAFVRGARLDDGVVGEHVHLRLRHLQVDLLAAEGELVGLQLGAREEALLGEALGPFEFLRGALDLFVREGDVGLVLAFLLRVVAFLVLLGLHLREGEGHLALEEVRVAVAFRDLELLLGDDEVALGGGDRDFLVVAFRDERGRVELDEQVAGLHVDAFVDDPDDRVVALELAAEGDLVAALDGAGGGDADREGAFGDGEGGDCLVHVVLRAQEIDGEGGGRRASDENDLCFPLHSLSCLQITIFPRVPSRCGARGRSCASR